MNDILELLSGSSLPHETRLRRIESMVLLLASAALDGSLSDESRRILKTKLESLQTDMEATIAAEDKLRSEVNP